MPGPNVHDNFVKRVFSDPENAAGEFRTLLPPALVAKLDLDTLRSEPTTFVDERLKDRHTDLLYSVKFRDGGDALLYVLFEHASSVDPLLVVRLFVYLGRIWDEWMRTHEGSRVPPIIPLVLFQGPDPWNAPVSLHEAIAIEPDALALVREHLPTFRFVLDDLALQSDEDIRAREMAVLGRVALLLLRHVREARTDLTALRQLIKRVADLVRLIPRTVDLVLVFTYILRVADVDPKQVQSMLGNELPDLSGKVLSAADQIELRGQREMFLRALTRRFGSALPPDLRQRVEAASAVMLDRWLDRVFTVERVEDVFGTERP